ncbi:hypothetical protein [Novosphingobium sp. HII-3]|uniref:hypothetical protein n=1 Tax=Novosphingobium sp. HII-3 TaxID=2075565 RepID=UPI000CDA0503|nr:hypothetical protein [Novosphingobium sp. HII-3]
MRPALLLVFAALPATAQAAPHTSPAAARQVVQRYYAAIEGGDFRTAYRLWDRGGQASGKSFAAFRQGFAATAHSKVIAGAPVDGDAGMSQRWIDVPVDVYAVLKNGQRQHFRGRYRLRRVVEGVGAPPAQQNWHIDSARLGRVG